MKNYTVRYMPEAIKDSKIQRFKDSFHADDADFNADGADFYCARDGCLRPFRAWVLSRHLTQGAALCYCLKGV
ncbi:MAG: hypothetical protein LBT76_03765, partial [Tannerella sp.]|nr:hypothetical protein [Tannerella sp.]